MLRNTPKTILNNIESSRSFSALGQSVTDLESYLDQYLKGADDGLGAFNIASKDADEIKDIGQAIFSKVFEITSSLAFAHDRSLPLLQSTVSQLNRAGLTHDVVEGLAQDSTYSPYSQRTLSSQIKQSKSSAGHFFEMLEGVKFSKGDEGMQGLLVDYGVALDAVRDEGSTEVHHRPTAGLRIFSDILPDQLRERLHVIGPAHAHNSFARALFIQDLLSDSRSESPEKHKVAYQGNNGFVNEDNARYQAEVILAESLTAAPDFMRFAETDADRALMAEQYLGVIDKVLEVAQGENWDYLAETIYPDAINSDQNFRDDLNALLNLASNDVLEKNADVVQRLRNWSEGEGGAYGSDAKQALGVT